MQAAPAKNFLSRHAVALFALAVAALAYVPIIFLRYDFHDSWAFLFIMNAARVYNFAITCPEAHQHSYLIGRPLAPATLCAMTTFGAVVDLIWVPKLQAFLALLASGGILWSELRRAGAGVAVVALAALSLLFLPGTVLMVAHMAANPIALAVLAATVAGYIWVRRLRRPAATRRGRFGWIALALALLIVSMAIYQVVATLFFAPVLIVLLFGWKLEGGLAVRFALGALLVFAAASAIYLAVHHTLLHGFHYWILKPEQIVWVGTTDRSVTLGFTPAHILEKLAYFGTLLPQVGTLWFLSEWAPVSWTAFFAAAGFVGAGGAVLARRPRSFWHCAAVALVVAAFFGPFVAGDNAGNRVWSATRVIVFMQVPVVLLVWWVVHLLLGRRSLAARLAAGAAVAAVVAGAVVSYLTVFRAYVIPNYMELVRIEYRLRDAVRRDLKQIYLIQPDNARIKAVFGTYSHGVMASVTSQHNPMHMMTAIVTEVEKRRPQRAIVAIPFAEGHTIAPMPGRLILDMRRFP